MKEITAAGGTACSVAADVLDRESLERAKKDILGRFGAVDLLINGAGGNHPDAITDVETYEEAGEGQSFLIWMRRLFNCFFHQLHRRVSGLASVWKRAAEGGFTGDYQSFFHECLFTYDEGSGIQCCQGVYQ